MSVIKIETSSDRFYYEVAVNAAREALEKSNVNLPSDYLEILTTSSTPHADLKPFMNSLGYEELKESVSINYTTGLALTVLMAVHDQWRVENLRLFHTSGKESSQFQFLPFYLVGFEVATRYYPYVEPVLTFIELWPAPGMLARFYADDQQIYLTSRGINNLSSLKLFLSSGEDIDVAQSVAQTLYRSKETLARVAEQVVANTPTLRTK